MPAIEKEFIITCFDTYGDGWKNEFLVVFGKVDCGDFDGHNFTTVMQNPIREECGILENEAGKEN